MTSSLLPLRIGRWLLAVSCLACTAESDAAGDDAAADDPCVPGQSIGCECDDGSPGARVCEPDGVGYEECLCAGDPSASSATDGPGSNGDDAGSDGPGDGPGDASDDSGADESPADSGSDSVGAMPVFADITPILYASCGAGDTLCHAQNAYFPTADQGCRGWLSLEDVPLGAVYDDLDPDVQMPSEGPVPGCSDKALYDRLILLAPWECGPDARYIVPGAPEQSYIFQKLTNGMTCGDFRVMPPPNEGFEITDEAIATLEAWILAGAPL